MTPHKQMVIVFDASPNPKHDCHPLPIAHWWDAGKIIQCECGQLWVCRMRGELLHEKWVKLRFWHREARVYRKASRKTTLPSIGVINRIQPFVRDDDFDPLNPVPDPEDP